MIVWCGSCETNTVDVYDYILDVSIEDDRPWCELCLWCMDTALNYSQRILLGLGTGFWDWELPDFQFSEWQIEDPTPWMGVIKSAPWVVYREEDYSPYTIDVLRTDGPMRYAVQLRDGTLRVEETDVWPPKPKEDSVARAWGKLGDVWRSYYPEIEVDDLYGHHYFGDYANIIRSEN